MSLFDAPEPRPGILQRAMGAWERHVAVREYETEQRDSESQRAAVSAYVLARAQGLAPVVAGGAIAAQEVAAGIVARAMCDAIVEGDFGLLRRDVRMNLGRALMTEGEYLGILLDDGRLYQSSEWDIDGGIVRRSWVYNVDLSGPTTTIRQTFPQRRVLHVLVDPSPREPWYGVPPVKRAGVTADLAGLLESALREDAQTPVKQIIPQPEGATEPTIAALEQALKDGAARLAMPPTTQAAYSEGRSSAPARDWVPMRLGPDPTVAEVQLAGEAQARVLASLGVHPSVMDPKATAGALREAHRQTQIDLIEPLGKIVEEAVSEFVERRVTIRWPLRTDVALVQTKVFDLLVKAGVMMPDAARVAGIRGPLREAPKPEPPVAVPPVVPPKPEPGA